MPAASSQQGRISVDQNPELWAPANQESVSISNSSQWSLTPVLSPKQDLSSFNYLRSPPVIPQLSTNRFELFMFFIAFRESV